MVATGSEKPEKAWKLKVAPEKPEEPEKKKTLKF